MWAGAEVEEDEDDTGEGFRARRKRRRLAEQAAGEELEEDVSGGHPTGGLCVPGYIAAAPSYARLRIPPCCCLAAFRRPRASCSRLQMDAHEPFALESFAGPVRDWLAKEQTQAEVRRRFVS